MNLTATLRVCSALHKETRTPHVLDGETIQLSNLVTPKQQTELEIVCPKNHRIPHVSITELEPYEQAELLSPEEQQTLPKEAITTSCDGVHYETTLKKESTQLFPILQNHCEQHCTTYGCPHGKER